MNTSASHVLTVLAVSDLERSVRFYREAFGWPLLVQVPVYVELALPSGMRLGLYQREGFARNTREAPALVPAGQISSTELYFHCPDLLTTIGRLERAGARMLSPLQARDWGDEAAYYADPDGNVVVVARPLKEDPTPVDPDNLRAIARRWVEPWQGQPVEILDELYAPDFVDQSPGGRSPDREGSKQGVRELYQAFPDFRGVIDDLAVEPESGKVTVRWSASGTHRGPFLGIAPTGRRIRFRGIEILRIAGGKIVERWGEWDGLDLLAQLGSGG